MNIHIRLLWTGSSLVFGLAIWLPSAMSATALKEARVTQVIQDVRLLESNVSPRPASVSDNVREGTAVRTGVDSRAELTFTDQTLTRLGANTLFNFGKESRTIKLDSGSVLIQLPKNSGGANILAGTVTAAITGTTVVVEYDARPPGALKYTVLEGSMCISLNGESVPIFAGQQLIFSPKAKSLPKARTVDLARYVEASPLTKGFERPLPSAALIGSEAQHQRELRALVDQLEHALRLAGASNPKDASTATFITAYSSIIIRAKNEEACLYAMAAATLRPDLIGEILAATRKSRNGEPKFSCECLTRIIRAAIGANPEASWDIVRTVVYEEPYARGCIAEAHANPCQEGGENLVLPGDKHTLNPAELRPQETVSPER